MTFDIYLLHHLCLLFNSQVTPLLVLFHATSITICVTAYILQFCKILSIGIKKNCEHSEYFIPCLSLNFEERIWTAAAVMTSFRQNLVLSGCF